MPLAANGVTVTHGHDRFVLLEPKKWVGTRMPILDYIENSGPLTHGDWEVMLHRHDCSQCQELLPDFIARNSGHRALIEIPPFEDGGRKFNRIANYQVSDRFDWFVTTPCRLELTDGVVQSVSGLSQNGQGTISGAIPVR